MVNKERIVPIQKMDLLTMIGTVLAIASVSYTTLASSDVEGDFTVTGTGDAGNILANQPVKTLDFASGVTAGTVYFVADYGFEGIKVAGAAATISESGIALADVKKDGVTVYKAALATGEVTITAVSPIIA